MKEQEGVNHHTRQPELTQPQAPHRYRIDHYGKSRNFAAYEGHTIIAVTLYRKLYKGVSATPLCRSQIRVLTPFMAQVSEACGCECKGTTKNRVNL